MKKIFFLLLLTLRLLSIAPAQTLSQSGDLAFERDQFAKAIKFYTKALKHTNNDDDKQAILFKLGDCYRLINNMSEAKGFYEQSINSGNTDPQLKYNYAISLQQTGNYNDAKKYIEEYLKSKPNDLKAIQILQICNYALIEETDQLIKITNEKNLNSSASDYGPCLIKDKLYFASSRFDKGNKQTFKYNGQAFSDFYKSNYQSKNSSFDQPERVSDKINSNYNEGTLTYDAKNKIMYFTRCDGQNGKENFCKIYSSEYDVSKDKWNDPVQLFLKDNKSSIGQPAISPDGNTLYFVSSMPGGLGGNDIWKIKKINNNEWSDPINLGSKINTPMDEEFPYLYGDSILYFSSNGLEGFGGLDMYFSIYKNDTFSKPQNLKRPVNSSYDDFGLIFLTSDYGLFCSNRPGGLGDDDIYSFKYIKILLNGTVTDKEDKPIEKATVVVKGDDGSSYIAYSDENGKYNIKAINPNADYKVLTLKTGLKEDSSTFSTKNFSVNAESTNYTLDFKLEKIKLDTVSVDTSANIKIVKEKDNIKKVLVYYAYSKWDVLSKNKPELDYVVKYLKENPNYNILLEAHTDERSSDTFNLKLSAKRAIYVVNYLIQNGINSNRIAYKAWGKSNPVVKHAKNEAEHQLNRRTSFNFIYINDFKTIVQNEGYLSINENSSSKKIKISQTKSTEKIPVEVVSEKNTDTTKNSSPAAFVTSAIDFRVQIASSSKLLAQSFYSKLETNIPEYKVVFTKDQIDNTYKYTMGSMKTRDEAETLLKRIKELGFNGFIVTFKNGQRVRK